MRTDLKALHKAMDSKLQDIEAMVEGNYKLTLLLRWIGDPTKDADIILSNDDLFVAGNTLHYRHAMEKR